MKSFLGSEEIKKIQKLMDKLIKDNIVLGRKIIKDNPLLEKYVLSLIIDAEKNNNCSYRYLIYNVLNAGQGSYVPLQLSGLLELHNSFYSNDKLFLNYEIDFSEKTNYDRLSDEDKISLISATIVNLKEKGVF